METLIAMTVTMVIAGVVLGIFTQGAKGFTDTQSRTLVNRAVETAEIEIGKMAKQAMNAEIVNGRLHLTMPKDTDTYGHPVPVMNDEEPEYREGETFAFYLSNETGAIGANGNVLWMGLVDDSGNIAPDSQWSLQGSNGRVWPITKFVPIVEVGNAGICVKAEIESDWKVKDEQWVAKRSLAQNLKNANSWR